MRHFDKTCQNKSLPHPTSTRSTNTTPMININQNFMLFPIGLARKKFDVNILSYEHFFQTKSIFSKISSLSYFLTLGWLRNYTTITPLETPFNSVLKKGYVRHFDNTSLFFIERENRRKRDVLKKIKGKRSLIRHQLGRPIQTTISNLNQKFVLFLIRLVRKKKSSVIFGVMNVSFFSSKVDFL